jgi:DNA-binding protein
MTGGIRTTVGMMDAKDPTVIYVGKKPLMSYVLAAVMQLNSDRSQTVIKARGRAISKAVDVAEVVRNRFVKDAKVDKINIGTEVLKNQEGNDSNVSFIEIYMSRVNDGGGDGPGEKSGRDG